MKHYEITQWADFVRGIGNPADLAAMSDHRSENCSRCNSTATLLERLLPMARAEARYEVPEFAVHCAKAISVLQHPETVEILPGVRTKLVYDSFCAPLPVGVRSQQRLSRQTLYQAGDYVLDLRQEHERGSRQVTLVGQIANHTNPGEPVSNLPVYLFSGNSVVAKAISNEFGEFQMDYDHRARLRLRAGIDPRKSHHRNSSRRSRSYQRHPRGGA